jgi:hypothetical protein
MNDTIREATEISPKIVPRQCGGWLALAPRTALFRIGVTAETEDAAKEKFRTVYSRWIEILNTEST